MQYCILLRRLEVVAVGRHDDPRRENYIGLTNRLQLYHTVLGTVGVNSAYGPLAKLKNIILTCPTSDAL